MPLRGEGLDFSPPTGFAFGWPKDRMEFSKSQSHPFKMAFVFLGLARVGPGRFSIDKD